MKNSKVLRGVCYCLIPILVLIIGFSIFYEFSFNYFNDYVISDGEAIQSYDYYNGYMTVTVTNMPEDDLMIFLDKFSFMEFAAPVIIPISTLILLIIIIFLIISIGHVKRKRRG